MLGRINIIISEKDLYEYSYQVLYIYIISNDQMAAILESYTILWGNDQNNFFIMLHERVTRM